MSLAMTKQERETFLAGVHVGIISIPEEGRGPLTVPIWYAYDAGGELRVVTARASRKGRLLARAGRFSLCAQTETPPYKYVSVEGPIIATEAADLERDLRSLAHRYLGIERGDRYIEQIRDAHARRFCAVPPRCSAPRTGSMVAHDRRHGGTSVHAAVRRPGALSKDRGGQCASVLRQSAGAVRADATRVQRQVGWRPVGRRTGRLSAKRSRSVHLVVRRGFRCI
jgi:nitroimidazol reductase NimA-like FMN-containing flavoprotein (pyridoxamine 5'-phosphate oxidase superfamily)